MKPSDNTYVILMSAFLLLILIISRGTLCLRGGLAPFYYWVTVIVLLTGVQRSFVKRVWALAAGWVMLLVLFAELWSASNVYELRIGPWRVFGP